MNKLVRALVMLLAGCAADQASVDRSHISARDKSYAIDLPPEWNFQFTFTGSLLASRDGYLLETLQIERRPLTSAFPNTNKTAGATTTPSQLANLAMAELKTSHGPARSPFQSRVRTTGGWPLMGAEELRFKSFAVMVYGIDEQQSAFTVLENEPARISGRDGFRLRIAYKIQRDLEMLQEVFGVTDRDSYYELSYVAPKLYYFEKYEPDFVKAVESFILAGTKSTRVQPSIEASRPGIAAPVAAPVVAGSLSRVIPTAPPVEISNLPRIGDRWIYRLSDRRRVLGMVDVSILETSAVGLKEHVTREGYPEFMAERNVEAKFNPARFQPPITLPGGYPIWEIAPYLPSSTQLSVGQSWGPISGEFYIPGLGKRTLATRVSVVSQEIVRVPAGEFEAWRLEAEPVTMGTGADNAVIKCTFWYSPQSLRTIKMRSDTIFNYVQRQSSSEIYELSRFEPAK